MAIQRLAAGSRVLVEEVSFSGLIKLFINLFELLGCFFFVLTVDASQKRFHRLFQPGLQIQVAEPIFPVLP